MPVSRRRYRRDTQALRDQIRRLVDERDQAVAEAETELAARRTITRQHAEADAANLRLDGRVRRLTEQLHEEHPQDLAEQVADLTRRLEYSERARRALDAQRTELLAANDTLCREAVDRAGTLALPEPAREHGGAS